jgi:hypothetical protein
MRSFSALEASPEGPILGPSKRSAEERQDPRLSGWKNEEKNLRKEPAGVVLPPSMRYMNLILN